MNRGVSVPLFAATGSLVFEVRHVQTHFALQRHGHAWAQVQQISAGHIPYLLLSPPTGYLVTLLRIDTVLRAGCTEADGA